MGTFFCKARNILQVDTEFCVPDSDFEYAGEELRVGGDELSAVEDEFLLQDGADDAERLHLGVDGLADRVGRHRLVEQREVYADSAHRHL